MLRWRPWLQPTKTKFAGEGKYFWEIWFYSVSFSGSANAARVASVDEDLERMCKEDKVDKEDKEYLKFQDLEQGSMWKEDKVDKRKKKQILNHWDNLLAIDETFVLLVVNCHCNFVSEI